MEWKMPDLGEGITEGEIIKWLVKEGDKVNFDQPLVEIMTDKATMEIPSPLEGVVQKLLLSEGAIAKIGQVMALIGEIGTEAERLRSQEAEKPRGQEVQRPAQVMAAPAVRKRAQGLGVDLSKIVGTGPGGRILLEDLEKSVPPKGLEERVPLRGLRRKIAEHMATSRKMAAHFTHVDEADLTELVTLRERKTKDAEAKGVKLTFLPYMMKAVITALKKYPYMNASLDEEKGEIVLKHYYNLGVAVATDQGLIVPVVKDTDKKTIFEIAKEIVKLSEEGRAGKIYLEDLKGGTFTLTNIGSVGGILSAPIINYPEVAIMGIHKIRPQPVVRDDKIEVRQITYLSVSADHRVVDGAYVAGFLNEVIRVLQSPERIQ